MKNYCEQMYNHARATLFSKMGRVKVVFSAAGCTDEELSLYREASMTRAVEVHDELWASGRITEEMSQPSKSM